MTKTFPFCDFCRIHYTVKCLLNICLNQTLYFYPQRTQMKPKGTIFNLKDQLVPSDYRLFLWAKCGIKSCTRHLMCEI